MKLEVKRLSYQKLSVENIIELKCGDKHIDFYNLTTRYRISEDFKLKIIFNDRFVTKISNIYGIKKKHIQIKLKKSEIIFENTNYPDSSIVFELEFNDPIWFIKYNRNLKINQLLNNIF